VYILIRFFILLMIIAACTQDKDRTLSGDRSSGTVSSYIERADIPAANPTVTTPLTVRYSAVNAEGKSISYKFRWIVDGNIVQESDNTVLAQGLYEKNSKVEVDVIPIVDNAETKAYRTKAVTILNSPPVVTTIDFSPIPAFPDGSITALVQSTDADKGDSINYSYEWEVDGRKMPASENNTLSTAGVRKKSVISVTVTPFDGQNHGNPFRSRIVLPLSNRSPAITSIPPSVLENGVYVYQVAARDPDGDPLIYTVVNGPEEMTIDRATGLIRWIPPQLITERKEIATKISADDGDGGVAYQEFLVVLEKK
jgi:hypothetical protein